MSATQQVARVVDYRGLAARDDSQAVLRAFDALAPGERLRLVFTAVPRRPLEVLQRARRGAFDWSMLQEGPLVWIVELHRRRAATGAPREIAEVMGWDHARLEELEHIAFAARHARRFAAAAEAFSWFAHGLDRHLAIEEDLLFPQFEERSGIGGEDSVTGLLRAEHRALRGLVELMEREVANPEAPAELARAALRRLLASHALKEDHVLYPAIDRLLSAEESDRTVARIQSWTRAAS